MNSLGGEEKKTAVLEPWLSTSGPQQEEEESVYLACVPPTNPATALLVREKKTPCCLLQGLYLDQHWLLWSLQRGTVH